MDMVPVYEGEEESQSSSTIKIDPTVIQNIGVKTAAVQKRRLAKVIRTAGKVEIDETRLFAVNTKIMGWVEKLHVNVTGQAVKKGQPLLELYSPDLVATQEEYLSALRYQRAVSGSDVKETVAGSSSLVESARRRLELWDISDAQILDLEKSGTPRRTLTFYSPADGIVMEKMVVQGASVMPGMDLFKIVDLSRVWVIADVYEYELPWVKIGEPAEMELAYVPGKIFRGKITYIYPMLSMESRTAKVRIEFANPRGEMQLRPEMFATVLLRSDLGSETIVVPEQAIIRSGERSVAIVAKAGGTFDVREVKVGLQADGDMQILDGLHEGEQLVVSSQFLIDSESNLRSAIAQFTSSHAGHGSERLSGRVGERESGGEREGAQTGAKKYTCEMHPEVIMDAPGDCPKCGMKLVEMK